MKWGIANSKASMGGSGDAELNLAYGLTPPSDTTKIWVRTDKTPTSVEITTEPTWSDVIETSIVKDNLTNIKNVQMVRAGEYVYILGGVEQEGNNLSSSLIRRYNTITNEIETLDIKLPYGIQFFYTCSYKDFIYIFYGQTYTGNYYFQPRVLKFNWKTNKIIPLKMDWDTANSNYAFYTAITGSAYVIGNKVYFAFGGVPYNPSFFPDSSNKIYPYSSSGGATVGDTFKISGAYNMDTDSFESLMSMNITTGKGANTQKINNCGICYGGWWSSASSLNWLEKNNTYSLNGTQINVEKKGQNLTWGYLNMVLTTNSGLFVGGGRQNPSSSSVSNTSNIFYIDYATMTYTSRAETMPNNKDIYGNCQFNEQTSYGCDGTNLIKMENKISLNEDELLIIQDIDGVDIYTIKGKDIAIKNIYIGDSNNKAKELRFYAYKNGSWVGLNCDDYVAQTKKDLSFGATWVDTTATSLTSGITCNVGDLIIASVIARDSGNESVSAGWTLLGRSQVGNLNQTLAFYKKIATSTFETITITQSTNARIYISMVNFVGKADAIMGNWSVSTNATSGQITLPNKLCLVGASCSLWVASSPYGDWTYTGNAEADKIHLRYNNIQSRLMNWVDDKGGERTISTPIIPPSENTFTIGYVEITDGNVLI